MVRGTVEEALNAMLDAEADRLCGAGRYERSEARKDTRAGSYERALETRAGQVSLKIPKLRRQTFETAIIERYRRRESSVEEALIEMYLAGVSVRRVEDITEALWGTRVSPSTVPNLNKRIHAKIEAWRNRPIEGEHPYVFLDGIVMKRTWAGEVRNASLLVAIGVNGEGFREILGICEGAKEDKSGWSAFLRHLVDRGLRGVELIISDACRGLVESVAEYLPDARWQRCVVHFYRNVFSHVPATKVREVSHMLKAIHPGDQGNRRGQGLGGRRVGETLTYYAFPDCHWIKLRTTDVIDKTLVASGAILSLRGRPRGEERARRLKALPGSLSRPCRLEASAHRRLPSGSPAVRASPAASARSRGAGAGGRRRGDQPPPPGCGTLRSFGGRLCHAATNCS
jgi:putative transposase